MASVGGSDAGDLTPYVAAVNARVVKEEMAQGESGFVITLPGPKHVITINSLEQSPTQVKARFTDGTEGTYDFVVGADGLQTKTRALILLNSPKPKFTGQAC